MAIHNANQQTFYQGSPQVTKVTKVPAPVKGIDSRVMLVMGNPEYCITCNNILPSEYGMRIRNGYQEWTETLDNGGPNHEVGTIIPFGGEDDNTADDRLFAATNEGIWDVTNATGVLELDFMVDGNMDNSLNAGYGVYTQYTTEAGEQILYYADSTNGMFQYSSVSDTWVRSTGIDGVDETQIIFVTSHQRQLWFIERNSSIGWYLPQAAITGVVTAFYFGSKFRHGGNLAGLFSWTVDGGEGVDDYLVAVGRAGDVLPYHGTDPGSADNWSSVGQWFIGAIPNGNKFASEFGGDLKLLSSYGIVGLGDLLKGPDGKNVQELTQTQQVAVLVRRRMQEYRLENGWELKYMPSIGSVIVTTPRDVNENYTQYVRNLVTNGWGLWRGVPANAIDEWRGKAYVGDKDGRILVMDVNVDNKTITPPLTGENGKPINFSVLTTYQDMGEPALFKRAKYVRDEYVARTQPASESTIRYDYNLADFGVSGVPGADNPSEWDDANDLWDSGVWTTDVPIGFNTLVGAWGSGRTIAIATRGSAYTETTLIGWNLMWDSGGPT